MGEREGDRSGLRWLLLFGGLLALLFVALAVTIGFGSARIPSGALVVVEGAGAGTGTIGEAELDQMMLQVAGIGGRNRPPTSGEEGYEPAKAEALERLINAVWLQGQAEAMGIVVSDGEVAAELKRSGRARSFREEHFTRKTMSDWIRRELLAREIEGALEQDVEKPTPAEVRVYYEEEPLSEEEPAEKKPFAEVKAEARARLQQIKNQEVFSEFDSAFAETWVPRTHCADGFVVEGCAEFSAFSNASPPACHEADPKAPAGACPAPVPERPTVQPGTITPFKKGGEALVQGPYPEVLEGEASGE